MVECCHFCHCNFLCVVDRHFYPFFPRTNTDVVDFYHFRLLPQRVNKKLHEHCERPPRSFRSPVQLFSSDICRYYSLTYLLAHFSFSWRLQEKKSRRLPSSVVVLVLQRRSSTERFFAPKGKFSESETNLFFLFLFFHRHSTQYRRKRIAPSSFHCL